MLNLFDHAVTTAIFSACGIPLWSFCLAAILSLPTQFVNVYLGFTLSTSSDNASEAEKVTEKIVLALTIIATVVGMWYIKKRIRDVMPEVIHARRKARWVALIILVFTAYPLILL